MPGRSSNAGRDGHLFIILEGYNNLVISVLCYFILRVAVGGSRADVANSRSPDRLTVMVIPQWFPGLSKLLLLGPGLAPLRGHCLKATHSLNCSTNLSFQLSLTLLSLFSSYKWFSVSFVW